MDKLSRDFLSRLKISTINYVFSFKKSTFSKGADGLSEIVPEEAEAVLDIYRMNALYLL